MAEKLLYKVLFHSREQLYEVYVKRVAQDDLYGFVLLEDFVFGENSAIVVDPSEEKLRLEFEGVQRSYVPLHQVVRIDQVKKRGTARILALDNAVAGKPLAGITPPKR